MHPNNTFWPTLLAIAFPRARILTYGYDVSVVGRIRLTRPGISTEGLKSYGQQLATDVKNSRQSCLDRPIIFVAHSLGGLVVEQALLVCADAERSQPQLAALITSTSGIVFLGTPHRGSSLGSPARRFAELYRAIGHNVNTSILGVLETRSEILDDLEDRFQQMLYSDWAHIRIYCFWEELPMRPIGMIVPRESAYLRGKPGTTIHANHCDMTKFAGEDDPGYIRVCGVLHDWVPDILKTLELEHATTAAQPAAAARPEEVLEHSPVNTDRFLGDAWSGLNTLSSNTERSIDDTCPRINTPPSTTQGFVSDGWPNISIPPSNNERFVSSATHNINIRGNFTGPNANLGTISGSTIHYGSAR